MLRLDLSARKALSLGKDAVFRLLVLMMIFLGWLAGMGAAGLLGLDEIYHQWQLNQKSHVSVYLMPDSTPRQIETLEEALIIIPGVRDIKRLDQDSIRQLVQPYLDDRTSLPLPKILDVKVVEGLDRAAFDAQVHSLFPLAEIDDARAMLKIVADGVQLAQTAVFAVASVIFIVLALLVSLTVRSGLQAQQRSLAVLQYVGATNGFLTLLVMQQVLQRAIIGTVGAAILGAACLWGLQESYDSMSTYLTYQVWMAIIAVPLALMVVVMVSAYWSAVTTLSQRQVTADGITS